MSYDPVLVGAFKPSALYFPVASVVLLPIDIGDSAVITMVFELIGGAPDTELSLR
jgi:hypothetical protein